jgi:excisionase family DNA binding protein
MSKRKDINGMLTISEVAQLLNVHINTVRRWSNQGTLKTYRVGSRGDRRFRQEDIDSFLSAESNDSEVQNETVSFDKLGVGD